MAAFDPDAPLPGAPDPWAGSEMPVRREGPPYAMTEMIAAEPALAERLLRRLPGDPALGRVADAIRAAASSDKPIIATGCGTSEHAAMVVAELLTEALEITIWPMQALEVARRPPRDGVLVAVSHEGGTWATNEALKAAGAAGSTTALITVSDRSPAAALADHVLATGEQDQSWCHTVGYLSPVIVAAALAGALRGAPIDPVVARALLEAAGHEPTAEAAAAGLVGSARLLIVGSGIDYPAARELALKIEEGARLPASALQLETIRHGHLGAADERTGLVVVLTDAEGWGETVIERSRAVLRSAADLGMPAAALIGADLGDDIPIALTTAGRMSVPLAGALPHLVTSAFATAIPLQLLAERLARARGKNPDTIGRDDPRQAAAAEA
ncbi:MAG: SIS domain-containing protein [Chloroflexi bacterium]|nr:SIS domain-containing protein [Chloroflexota bacterium]